METHVIAIICLVIASVWDLKLREVPDYLSYTLVGSLCMIALYNGMYMHLLAALLLLAVGWLFVYGGAWGGADAKLLPLFAFVTLPFSLEYFLVLPLLFTVGAVYGFVWVFVLTFYHYHGLLQWVQSQSKWWLACIPLFILAAYVSFPLAGALAALILFTLSISYLHTCEFSQSVPFIKVVPGDWLMVPLTVGSKTFDGLVTESLCRKIHVLGYQGKIDTVQVKYGIPFIPAFLFTYMLYLCKDYLLTLM